MKCVIYTINRNALFLIELIETHFRTCHFMATFGSSIAVGSSRTVQLGLRQHITHTCLIRCFCPPIIGWGPCFRAYIQSYISGIARHRHVVPLPRYPWFFWTRLSTTAATILVIRLEYHSMLTNIPPYNASNGQHQATYITVTSLGCSIKWHDVLYHPNWYHYKQSA